MEAGTMRCDTFDCVPVLVRRGFVYLGFKLVSRKRQTERTIAQLLELVPITEAHEMRSALRLAKKLAKMS